MFPGAISNDLSTWDGGLGELLQTKCGMCHGTSGGLSLASYADALKGGTNGAGIIPGDADTSVIVNILEAGGHPGQLTADELAALKAWILSGAPEK
jgi:hypothetical protein